MKKLIFIVILLLISSGFATDSLTSWQVKNINTIPTGFYFKLGDFLQDVVQSTTVNDNSGGFVLPFGTIIDSVKMTVDTNYTSTDTVTASHTADVCMSCVMYDYESSIFKTRGSYTVDTIVCMPTIDLFSAMTWTMREPSEEAFSACGGAEFDTLYRPPSDTLFYIIRQSACGDEIFDSALVVWDSLTQKANAITDSAWIAQPTYCVAVTINWHKIFRAKEFDIDWEISNNSITFDGCVK